MHGHPVPPEEEDEGNDFKVPIVKYRHPIRYEVGSVRNILLQKAFDSTRCF